jgi:hypothetical protein
LTARLFFADSILQASPVLWEGLLSTNHYGVVVVVVVFPTNASVTKDD